MTILIIVLLSLLSFLFGKYIFKKWFNPLAIYAFLWTLMLILFNLRLIKYTELDLHTYLFIGGAYISFILGILSINAARNCLLRNRPSINNEVLLKGNFKILKIIILIFSYTALLTTLYNWFILIKLFGSLSGVIINTGLVYQLRVERQIPGTIPYLSTLGYSAVFFAGVYTALRNKFSFTALLPFVVVILSEIANAGRAGMLLSIFIFFSTFILMRNYVYQYKKVSFISKNIVVSFSIILILIMLSATFVRSNRGTFEHYTGASRGLVSLKKTEIITPSMYLYFSAHVGVFDKYLELEKEQSEIGENTFLILYSILSKFKVVDRPSDYQKGYFVPVWSNTGTYLRELHADFGIFGILGVPYFLGMLITYLWFRFYEGNGGLFSFTILVYMLLIIEYSYVVMVTRLAIWVISFSVCLISIPIMEILVRNYNKNSISA